MIRKTVAPQVEWIEFYDATTSTRNFGLNPQLDTGPRTIIALTYPEGSGEGTTGVIVGQQPTGGLNDGPRFSIEHASGSPNLQYRQSSSGSAGAPARNAAASSVTYNAWNHVAVTYDGGLTGSTAIRLFNGINGAQIAECSYGGAANGSGSIRTGVGNNYHIGNREDTDRTFNGSIAYVAQWNRVLDLQDIIRAQRQGPLAIPGLVLLWANSRDYGPYKLRPYISTAIVRRARPTYYAPLGVIQSYIPINQIGGATFNAAWNAAANTVHQSGARAA